MLGKNVLLNLDSDFRTRTMIFSLGWVSGGVIFILKLFSLLKLRRYNDS